MGWSWDQALRTTLDMGSETFEGAQTLTEAKTLQTEQSLNEDAREAKDIAKLKTNTNQVLDTLIEAIMQKNPGTSRNDAFQQAVIFLQSDKVERGVDFGENQTFPNLIKSSPGEVLSAWNKTGTYYTDPTLNVPFSIQKGAEGYQSGADMAADPDPGDILKDPMGTATTRAIYDTAESLSDQGVKTFKGEEITPEYVFEQKYNTPADRARVGSAMYDYAIANGIEVDGQNFNAEGNFLQFTGNPIFEAYGYTSISTFTNSLARPFAGIAENTLGTTVSLGVGDPGVNIKIEGESPGQARLANVAYDIAVATGAAIFQTNGQVPAVLPTEITQAYRGMFEEAKELEDVYKAMNRVDPQRTISDLYDASQSDTATDRVKENSLNQINKTINKNIQTIGGEKLLNLENTEIVYNDNGSIRGYRVYKPFENLITKNAEGNYESNFTNLDPADQKRILENISENGSGQGLSLATAEGLSRRAIAERRRITNMQSVQKIASADPDINIVDENIEQDIVPDDTSITTPIVSKRSEDISIEDATSDSEDAVPPDSDDIDSFVTNAGQGFEGLVSEEFESIVSDIKDTDLDFREATVLDSIQDPVWALPSQNQINRISSQSGLSAALSANPEFINKFKEGMKNPKGQFGNLTNKLNVAIAQNNTEKARGFVDSIEQLLKDNPKLADDNKVMYSRYLQAKKNVPVEIAKEKDGGAVLPKAIRRFNKGGIMRPAPTGVDNITVTGKRDTEPSIDVGMSLMSQIGRGIDTSHPESPDGTFDPDLYESAMMERDEGYDEAYNYSQMAKEELKKDLPKSIKAASLKTDRKGNPVVSTKGWNSIAQYLTEGDEKIIDNFITRAIFGKDQTAKAFDKYEEKLGANQEYEMNAPAGLGF